MITYHKGDLLKDDADCLLNTVNTVGVMGKGVALAFKNAFPHNYLVYRNAFAAKQLSIGKLLVVSDVNLLLGQKTIINFPTKTHWRLPSEYSYIVHGLNALKDFLTENDVRSVAMPALGCGNGGLDWEKVKPLIEDKLSDLGVHIRVYEPL
ncbi:macro domain-containing protein [Mucilaginibacter pocheonensis]|uniref:O-acetyl-ADP-ribose deacetylase (Regulator of RNase III) n=1 Tax=Mucilaginibacter pocheonensis TaxID=398050 RepID=A0ABU1TE81_9SPHI|nr:macro domain-containing protein [Mucilaginibacter pocheonensis]MDR6943707.1 O-acetyl-ADP-ribose deacetylase (regulator of RNase III) [Mucilaginibacter pocheonensis]